MSGAGPPPRIPPHDPNNPLPRIPKLKVRGSANTVSPPPSYVTVSPAARPIRPVLRQMSSSNTTDHALSFTSSIAPSPTPSSSTIDAATDNTGSPDLTPQEPQEEKKSKRGRLFALTLKEPSQAAFRKYAEQEKQKANLKSTSSAKLAAVSQQKLPANVPKVNSKWNGMPDNTYKESGSWRPSLDFTISRQSPKASTECTRTSTSTNSASSDSTADSRKTVKKKTTLHTQALRVKDDDALPSLSRLDSLGDAAADAMTDAIREAEEWENIHTRPPRSKTPATVKFMVPEDSSFSTQSHYPPVHVEEPDTVAPSDSSASCSPLTPVDSISERAHIPGSPLTPVSSPLQTCEQLSISASQESPVVPRVEVQTFRCVEDIPQWPLRTRPEDVIIDPHSPPQIPLRSPDRSSSYRVGESDSSENHSIESYFPMIQPSASSPVGRSQRLGALIPPRKAPGRAVLKDTDLDTIPESDTASILHRGPTEPGRNGLSSNRTSLIFDDSAAGRLSMAESRPSSEVSAQWYRSRKDMTGLGGFIKAGKKDAPWPLPVEEDEDYIVEGNSLSPVKGRHGKAGKGRRTSLMGVFRR